jgi:hypothetical protein
VHLLSEGQRPGKSRFIRGAKDRTWVAVGPKGTREQWARVGARVAAGPKGTREQWARVEARVRGTVGREREMCGATGNKKKE